MKIKLKPEDIPVVEPEPEIEPETKPEPEPEIKPAPILPSVAPGAGKEVLRSLIVDGKAENVLHTTGVWAEHVQTIAGALEQVVERARASVQNNTPVGGLAVQPPLTANPALFVNLLKTNEFQQVLSVILVQVIK